MGAAQGAALPPAVRAAPTVQASIGRRRRVASCGALPPQMTEWFSEGQRATLSVVGREAARGRPWCDWPLDRIAALAGVGRTTARDALRLAERLGLLRVRERRRRGAKSDTNVVSVTAKAWWRWLKRGPKRSPDEWAADPAGGGGSERSGSTDIQELRRKQESAEAAGGPYGEPQETSDRPPRTQMGSRKPREGPTEGA